MAMCLGCENAEPLPLEAEDAPKPLGVEPQGLTVESLQKMQQKQGFDPPRRAASGASTKFGGDPTDMTDEEIKEYLVKGVQRCSLLAMELVHGRSLQLPETRGMYVLASRAWVEEQQRKEQWAEAELYYPTCALQGIAARWLSAHYKTIARVIARAIPRGLGFVTPCPNKQGKNAYFSKVSDAFGTACDAVNVRKDCQHFGPPLWVVPVEERGPFGGPS